jgi:hypothetical protein
MTVSMKTESSNKNSDKKVGYTLENVVSSGGDILLGDTGSSNRFQQEMKTCLQHNNQKQDLTMHVYNQIPRSTI